MPLDVAPQMIAHGWRAAVIGCALFVLVMMPPAILLFLRVPLVVADQVSEGVDIAAVANADAVAPSTLDILTMSSFWMPAAAVFPVGIVAHPLIVNIIPYHAERKRCSQPTVWT